MIYYSFQYMNTFMRFLRLHITSSGRNYYHILFMALFGWRKYNDNSSIELSLLFHLQRAAFFSFSFLIGLQVGVIIDRLFPWSVLITKSLKIGFYSISKREGELWKEMSPIIYLFSQMTIKAKLEENFESY